MTPQERQAVIGNAVKLIEDRDDLFKFLLKAETGQPQMIVDMMQYGAAISGLQYYSTAADKFTWSDIRDGIYGQTLVLREPIGVVGAVAAWNVPLFLACNKLGPALLAGCTMVLKPAAETPLSVNALAEVFAEAGLPEGVLSVVPGGAETGRALTANPLVDKYTFTGSSAVGKEVGKLAAEKLKPCTLELGGKSAAIILEDADIDSTLPMLLFAGLMNSGQACVAQTRILAPRSRYEEIVTKLYIERERTMQTILELQKKIGEAQRRDAQDAARTTQATSQTLSRADTTTASTRGYNNLVGGTRRQNETREDFRARMDSGFANRQGPGTRVPTGPSAFDRLQSGTSAFDRLQQRGPNPLMPTPAANAAPGSNNGRDLIQVIQTLPEGIARALLGE
jgi:acyl-CoA reductase-like NAD-dependent aldehyde dehydrogenase